jgi:hypothetical protein
MITQEMAEAIDDLIAETGWEIIDEVSLGTPDGYVIEWDGMSPTGEVSILRQLGLI